jgi:hypothetical protein
VQLFRGAGQGRPKRHLHASHPAENRYHSRKGNGQSMNLYLTKNGQQLGPYPLEEVQRMVVAGTFHPGDLAWYEGLANWIPLHQVPGFAPAGTFAAPPPARPALVWVISIFYFVCTPIGLISLLLMPFLFSFLLHSDAGMRMPEAQRHLLESYGPMDYILGAANSLIVLAGALYLFWLRRPALYCFAATFVISVINLIYKIVFQNWLASMDGPGMIGGIFGMVFGFGLSIAIISYVAYLFYKGVLR